jgi:hypothetical protein
MHKLYCYVDENGMETKGRLFVVAVIVLDGDPQEIFSLCEAFEQASGKGNNKWRKAKHVWRLDFMRRVFAARELQGHLCYVVFHGTQDYEAATVEAVSRTIRLIVPHGSYRVAVYVDALTKSKRMVYGARLRKTGVAVHKVQGVAKDENNALVRLADAVAGFVRDAIDGESAEITTLFEAALQSGALVEA